MGGVLAFAAPSHWGGKPTGSYPHDVRAGNRRVRGARFSPRASPPLTLTGLAAASPTCPVKRGQQRRRRAYDETPWR